MAPPNSNSVVDINPLLESHEDRLQRVEGLVSSTREDVSALKVDVGALGQAVAAGFLASHSKLDKALEGIAGMEPRLASLETERKASDARKRWVRNSIIGLVLTALGGAATAGAERFVGLFH